MTTIALISIALSVAATAVSSLMVTGLESQHFWQMALSLVVVSLAAAIACSVLAYRAARANPVVALRYE